MAFFETIFPSLTSNDPSDINNDRGLVSIRGSLGGADSRWKNITPKEIVLGESLITPGLQTAVTFQSYVYDDTPKILSELKNSSITLDLYSQLGERQMDLGNNHKIYRVDNRELMPSNVGQTEEFTIHACDDSLLQDAQTLVSKSWKCTTPSDIVDYALRSCVGAENVTVDDSKPARDYIAEKIHPFQVIAQQANVALDEDDPSFVHYMTYEKGGTHYFRSLKKMSKSDPVNENNPFEPFEVSALGQVDYNKNLYKVINFSFPCDFDYLSDLLNGIDENGENLNVLGTFNPLSGAADFLGGNFSGSCGKGANYKQSMTNKGTAEQQSGCETDVEKHLLKRQARMGLLERDKTALRMTVPWNPNIHVGQVIKFNWPNKKNGSLLYGSGNYIVSSLMHRIMFGGFSTTTLDCITRI